jgi:hypothetical protein
LAGKEDVPITPNEERTFGSAFLPDVGVEYVLSPDPTCEVCADRNMENDHEEDSQLIKHNLICGPIDYNPMITYVDSKKNMKIEGIEVACIPLEQCYTSRLLPGITLERQPTH